VNFSKLAFKHLVLNLINYIVCPQHFCLYLEYSRERFCFKILPYIIYAYLWKIFCERMWSNSVTVNEVEIGPLFVCMCIILMD